VDRCQTFFFFTNVLVVFTGPGFQRPPGMMGQPQGNARGPQQQVGQSSQQQQGQQGQKKNVLKFEGDYDFEQANTEFENLRAQLANIKLTATAAGQLPNSTAEVTPTSAGNNHFRALTTSVL
jgi:hypothetical protein